MLESAGGIVLALHLGSTLFMAGVVWFVQIVHYPLLPHIGRDAFAAYEREHMRRTARVVAPAMLIELVTGIVLLWVRPGGIPLIDVLLGLALLAVVCGSTQFVQVPCHVRLSQGFDCSIHRRLVSTNWLRTVAWSLRGVLVMRMVSSSGFGVH
jgi:hypothetical protein